MAQPAPDVAAEAPPDARERAAGERRRAGHEPSQGLGPGYGRALLFAALTAAGLSACQFALGAVASHWAPAATLPPAWLGMGAGLASIAALIWLSEVETSRRIRLGLAATAVLLHTALSQALIALGLRLEPGAPIAAVLAAVLAPAAWTWQSRGHLIDRVRRRAVATAGDEILIVDPQFRVLQASAVALGLLKVEPGSRDLPASLTRLLKGDEPRCVRLRTRGGEMILEAWTTAAHGGGPRGIVLRDVTDRTRDEKRLLHLAHYDSLTRLANRRLFLESLTRTLEDAQADGSLVGLFYIDLDGFKSINDSLGHGAGDQLLEVVADRFRRIATPAELAGLGLGQKPLHIARLSGDEFAITVPGLPNAHLAYDLATRVLDVLAQPVTIDDQTLRPSASIGIAIGPDDGDTVDGLIGHADTALYTAKSRGRSRYARYENTFDEAGERKREIEKGLQSAIERGELRLCYQPKVDLRTGVVSSFEALMRWRNAELGDVSPGEFIPVAEDRGLVTELGTWAIEEACRQMNAWREDGFSVVPVAVNVSSHQFAEGDLQAIVVESLKRNAIDPELLELELTERLLLAEGDQVEMVLRDLRAIGVRIALDDFGTGYSSLAYLNRFALDVLKIDRNLLRDIDTNPSAAGIVRAVVSMAHSLGLTVVAEGVDDEQQLPLLRDMRCDQIQGFIYAPALPADEAARHLATASRPAPICPIRGQEAATPEMEPSQPLDDAPALREAPPSPAPAQRQEPAPPAPAPPPEPGATESIDEIVRVERGRLLVIDDGDGFIGSAALRLGRLGIDTHYAAEIDEARLLINEEGDSIRAVAVAPGVELDALDGIIDQLAQQSGERRRVVMIGERPDAERREEIRSASVDWVLWAPFNDTELRCLIKSAMVRPGDAAERREPRVPVELVATVSSGQRREVAVVSSLSPGGAFIEMDEPLPIGSTLRIDMEMPQDRFRGFARVVHSTQGDRMRAAEPSGMGVVFFGSDLDTERLLRKAVKELESRYLP